MEFIQHISIILISVYCLITPFRSNGNYNLQHSLKLGQNHGYKDKESTIQNKNKHPK